MKCLEDERLDYNPDTGVFTWIISPAARIKPGAIAGGKTGRGYWHISIKGRRISAHYLAWNTLHPEDRIMPGEEIDHINHNKIDNRGLNLRKVKRVDNSRNLPMKKTNTSGITGVYWRPVEQKWRATIKNNGMTISLGYFDSKEMAAAARKRAEEKYGFHNNHGVSQ